MDAIQQTLLQYGALGVMAVLLIGTVIYQAKQNAAKDREISELWKARLDDARTSKAAGAMILSLVAARAATAFPWAALGILLIWTPVCVYIAIRPYIDKPVISRVGSVPAVIAIAYVPRLLCYAANAFSLLDRAMMWEFSNAFLILQIAALFAGVIGGGHVIFDRLSMGATSFARGPLHLRRAAAPGDRAERDPSSDI